MKKRKKNLHILIDQVKLRSEEEKYIKKKKMKNWGEQLFLGLGWVAISPFLLFELIVKGFKWVVKKIKRK
jgi:hypothetical protein|tara:strand:+ start:3177 stop:3386 length:210 start_codon:yes stop_codon:yes gene_type:complete